MKAVKCAHAALRARYPREPNFQECVRAAYDDVMRQHYNGELLHIRNARRNRVCGVDNVNIPTFSKLLGSYIGNHREVFTTWKEDFKNLYHEVEEADFKHLEKNSTPQNRISFDQVVSMVIASMYGFSVARQAYMWSRTPFGDIQFTKGDASYVYAHTHLSLDNKTTGMGMVNMMKSPFATEIYRNTFTLYPDGDAYNVMHAMTAPDDRTLVAGHTLWYVKEQEHFYVERPGMAPAMIIPRLYTFVEYNDRLQYASHETSRGKLCQTKKSLWKNSEQ